MKVFVPLRQDSKLVTKYDEPVYAMQRLITESQLATECFSSEEADIIIIYEFWETRGKTYKQVILNCPLARSHLRKLYTINCDDIGRGFLPGCYTSLNPGNYNRRLHLAGPYPYDINLPATNILENDEHPRELLFSFRGNPISHPLRERLINLFSHYPEARVGAVNTQFHHHSDDEKSEYTKEILNSKFVLCPRGWSPTTYRLFEVMALGRCPVIISDDWIVIGGVPWEEFTIRIKESDIESIPGILSQCEKDAERLGNRARDIWQQHFSPENRSRFFLECILKLHQTNPHANFDIQSWWDSKEFRKGNGWLISQRIRRGVNRLR